MFANMFWAKGVLVLGAQSKGATIVSLFSTDNLIEIRLEKTNLSFLHGNWDELILCKYSRWSRVSMVVK